MPGLLVQRVSGASRRTADSAHGVALVSEDTGSNLWAATGGQEPARAVHTPALRSYSEARNEAVAASWSAAESPERILLEAPKQARTSYEDLLR